MRAAPLILAGLLLAGFSSPAAAHRLKLFATLENGVVSGYAFFVGSGRAHGAAIAVTDESGKEVARLVTDDEGAYSWKPPAPQTYKLEANTGDGHIADAVIDRSRFGGADETAASADAPAADAPAAPAAAAPAAAVTQAQIERAVDAAVARQIRPLLEAYDAAEGRTRFNDIMGGVGMIVGLAGVALWASSRRKGAKA